MKSLSRRARPSSPTFSDCEVKGIEWLRLLTLPVINSTPEAHTHTGRERVSGADDELMRPNIINHLESRVKTRNGIFLRHMRRLNPLEVTSKTKPIMMKKVFEKYLKTTDESIIC